MRHPRILTAAVVLVGLALAGTVGFGVAVHQLKRSLEQSLGPRASVGTLQVGWNGVQALDVRVRADRTRGGWPAEDELRARRVHLVPAFASLWRPGWHIRRVTIEDAYVSALRTRDGRLRVFPSLFDESRADTAAGGEARAPLIQVGALQVANAALDFHDASVRQPPHRLRIERLNAEVGPLVLPALDQSANVELRGVVKGPRGDGELHIAGEFTAATRDAQLKARFNGVDLVALQPYLLKVSESENLATRVASGLAETLGVSLGGVVQGVGSVIKGIFGR